MIRCSDRIREMDLWYVVDSNIANLVVENLRGVPMWLGMLSIKSMTVQSRGFS